LRLFALVTALVLALSACQSEEEEPVPARTESGPSCVPSTCGLAPPHRRDEDGSAYKLTAITGESFWVVLPDELAATSGVVAVPKVPVRVNANLTTAAPRKAADRFCEGFPACKPVAVDGERSPTRWDDASGSIRDLGVTTLDLGTWTLVLAEPDAARAERVARAITARIDADGYPHLTSTDPAVPLDADWAGVSLWLREVLIDVIPGCALARKDPALGGADAGPELELHEPETVRGGSWCAGGRYWVDVTFADRRTLERLHETLRVVPG
jgi:hypothetical protein